MGGSLCAALPLPRGAHRRRWAECSCFRDRGSGGLQWEAAARRRACTPFLWVWVWVACRSLAPRLTAFPPSRLLLPTSPPLSLPYIQTQTRHALSPWRSCSTLVCAKCTQFPARHIQTNTSLPLARPPLCPLSPPLLRLTRTHTHTRTFRTRLQLISLSLLLSLSSTPPPHPVSRPPHTPSTHTHTRNTQHARGDLRGRRGEDTFFFSVCVSFPRFFGFGLSERNPCAHNPTPHAQEHARRPQTL